MVAAVPALNRFLRPATMHAAVPGNDPATAGVGPSVDNGDHDDENRTAHPAGQPEPQGPRQRAHVPLDTTKGHRDDEKNNIREQAEHGNMTQNTSNRRSG